MEARGHDAIGGVERFLHAVAVMHVDVNVQDTLVISDRRSTILSRLDKRDRSYLNSSRIPSTISGARQPMLRNDLIAPTIDIAEPACLGLFGVMKTSSPIHRDIAFVPRQSRGTLWYASVHEANIMAGSAETVRTTTHP